MPRTNTSHTPNVGPNLRRLREARKWTRNRLAAEAKTASITIAQIELGTRGIGLALAQKLADALGATVNDLLAPADKRR